MAPSIIAYSMHKIDIDSSVVEAVPTASVPMDLMEYLEQLLKEISSKETKRNFLFKRDTTEFYVSLSGACNAAHIGALSNETFGNNLAERLLEAEIKSEERMSRLSPDGHLRRGSFLQFFYQENEEFYYLGIKVEHTSFIDENDFIKKIGMPELHKSYKATRTSFGTDNRPLNISIYDTNSSIAKYWWDDFLELKEKWDDKYNTGKASEAVIKKLNGIQRDHPRDHTILRNATLAAFRQGGTLDYNQFIDNTFANYQAEDPTLQAKLPKLVQNLKKLPETKDFDTQFQLVPSVIKYRKRKINLTPEIEITYDENISEISNKIWASRLTDGKEVVIIHSPEGFKQFVQKNI